MGGSSWYWELSDEDIGTEINDAGKWSDAVQHHGIHAFVLLHYE